MADIREDEFDGRPELVKKRARAIFWTRVAWFIGGAYLFASLALLGYNAISADQTRATLLDCTSPGGECYAENQKNTAEVIQQLIDANNLGDLATQRVVILAAACAEDPDVRSEPDEEVRTRLIEDCINEQLKGGN